MGRLIGRGVIEYHTAYPRTVSLPGGRTESIRVDARAGVEHLHVVVRRSVDELVRIFKDEGFTRVKFEHKKPSQIGHGLNLKLKKPWEMHVRFVELKKGVVAIQGEVEVSRDYLQHLFSQNTPVVYEIGEILKRNGVDYRIWNARIKRHVGTVVDNYRIRLSTPNLPVFAWKPMVAFIGAVGAFYLWKYVHTL